MKDEHISWQLDDLSGIALSNVDLPTSFDLSLWTQAFGLTIEARYDLQVEPWFVDYFIRAVVDTCSLKVPRFINKALDPPDGKLGDIVCVTINVGVPTGETATIRDTLPPELQYVVNSFTVNGNLDTPTVTTIVGPPPTQQISYNITTPGSYIIKFKVQVVKAYWADRTVTNAVIGFWYDQYGNLVGESGDVRIDFVVHPFRELHKNVGMRKADVVFAIDTNYEMSEELMRLISDASFIVNSITTMIADVQFGVIYLDDYNLCWIWTYEPTSVPQNYTQGYAPKSDPWPYNLAQDITPNKAAVVNAIVNVPWYDGGDMPQAYTRTIMESYNDTNLHWRTGAEKILILIGNGVPHDSHFDYNDDTIYENTGLDLGRDGNIRTPDDLDFETEVANAAAHGVHILGVYSGDPNNRYPWEYMATHTNGEYAVVNAAQIPDTIPRLVKKQAEKNLIIKTKTDFQWAVLDIVNPFPYTMTDMVITDHFGVQIEIDPPFPYSITHGEVSYITRGTPRKVFLTWNVGNLLPGETARIMFLVSTCVRNGKQEYINPGVYEINSGAHLKFTDPIQSTRLSAVTAPINVTVLPRSDP